jgi:anti-sigma B factor antagonist
MLSNNSAAFEKAGMKIVASENGSLATLYGRIDVDSSPAIRNDLVNLLQAAHWKKVSIDLSAVTQMDSSGVATLIEALKIARCNSIELRLQGLHDRLLRLFEITGLLPLFNGSVTR